MTTDDIIRKVLNIRYFANLPYSTQSPRSLLAVLFCELGFTEGAEIGIWRGRFTETLCLANPALHMTCVDPWGECNAATSRDMARAYRHAMARLPKYNTTVMRIPSLQAAEKIEDESLDFVYIDALHDFDSIMKDLFAWIPKVKKGGIISGHDYTPFTNFGVIHAVDAYTRGHNIQNWYVTGDWPASYLWVK